MKFTFAGMALLAMLFFSGALIAQPYRQLTAGDFQGRPQLGSGVIAYTNCSIDFQYTAQHRDGYYILNFTIRLVVNNDKSWLDKARITSPEMLAEILKHEQGHYNIAYLEQHELLRELSKTRFDADYRQKAVEIFNRIDAKYQQLNLDYDDDTAHMTNRVQQVSWDKYFNRKLEFMPPLN